METFISVIFGLSSLMNYIFVKLYVMENIYIATHVSICLCTSLNLHVLSVQRGSCSILILTIHAVTLLCLCNFITLCSEKCM